MLDFYEPITVVQFASFLTPSARVPGARENIIRDIYDYNSVYDILIADLLAKVDKTINVNVIPENSMNTLRQITKLLIKARKSVVYNRLQNTTKNIILQLR